MITATAPTADIVRAALATATGPLTPAEVTDATGAGYSTVKAVLLALHTAGEVTRERDGRGYRYTLPTATVTALPAAAPVVEDAAEYDDPSGDDVAPVVPIRVDPPVTTEVAPACHCGSDEVGHVHRERLAGNPRKRTAPAATKPVLVTPRPQREGAAAGKVARARAAAVAALAAAGPDGLTVPAVWDVMQLAGPLAHQGAYTLVNVMRADGAITTTDERAVRERRAVIAAGV